MKKTTCAALAVITAALVSACGLASKDNTSLLLLALVKDSTASCVYGQGGSFSANISNNGGISAESLRPPCGLAVYEGRLYVADPGNNRELFY